MDANQAKGRKTTEYAGDAGAPPMQPMHKHALQPGHPMYEQGLRVLEHGHFVTDTYPVPGWIHDHPDTGPYEHPVRLRRPSR